MLERASFTLIVAALGIALWAPSLEAQSEDLVLRPDRPQRGEQVRAIYRSSMWAEPYLHLRARLRTPNDGRNSDHIGSRAIAVLARQPDGSYVGQFELPGDVVYAAFAVEDRLGMRTDSRHGQFWDLVVHGPDGRPRLQGLEQRFNDLLDRDERPLLEIARAMVEHYPDRLESWNTLRMAESFSGDEAYEAAQSRHRDRAHALDRSLTQGASLDPDQMGLLFSYAMVLREQAIAERWRARLMAANPGHYFAIVDPVLDLQRTYSGQPTALARELEPLWDIATGSRARLFIAARAFAAARQTADTEAVLLWADRYAILDPTRVSSIAGTLAATDATRDEGIRWLQHAVADLDPAADRHRPLGMTRTEFVAKTSRQHAVLETQLGRALLAGGRTPEAIVVLDRAATVGWDTDRFRTLGEARLSAGDAPGAIAAFALAAADPGTPDAAADSLRRALALEPTIWEDAVTRAEAEMIQKTMAGARSEELPSIQLTDRDQTSVRLESLFGRDASIVVFWSRYCGFSHQAMPEIVALAERLRHLGVPLLAVTRDPPAESEAYLTENGWELQVLYDVHGQAGRALNSWATPQYFVLDGAGRVRFAFTSLVDIPRQLLALQPQARPQ